MNIFTRSNRVSASIFASLAMFALLLSLVPMSASAVDLPPEPVCINDNMLVNASFEDPTADANAFESGFYEVFPTVTGWLSSSFEVWNNMFGGASAGSQNLELDVDSATTITQEVTTVPGATYKLSFDFSARPGVADNSVEASADGNLVASASLNGSAVSETIWGNYYGTFVATEASTEITFSDTAGSNGEGSLLDNTSLCLVSIPDDTTITIQKTTSVESEQAFSFYLDGNESPVASLQGGESSEPTVVSAGSHNISEGGAEGWLLTNATCLNEAEEVVGSEDGAYYLTLATGDDVICTFTNTQDVIEVDTYRIEGLVYNDDNGSATQDEGEEGLAGRVVNITDNDGDNRSTETDANGFYFFEVPAGTWTITETLPDDWNLTTQESHMVTVPTVESVELIEFSPEVTLLDSIVDFIIPTAHAAVIGRPYGPFNFGNEEDRRGGGGGTRLGDRNNDDAPDGEVLGDSDDATPAVLGDQVSAVPAGAPNAGAGSTAPRTIEFFSGAPVAILSRTKKHG